MSKLNDIISQEFMKELSKISENTNNISEKDIKKLELIYKMICKPLGISENGKWIINWTVSKFNNMKEYIDNIPYETITAPQNIILDVGATEMLKLICGVSGANAYSNANAKIQVGTSSSPENAGQTGLIAQGGSKFEKGMEATYPQVSGRTMVFKSVFDEGEANFAWNEFSITNGTVNMNRKVQNLGTKNTGVWSIQITVSVTSN